MSFASPMLHGDLDGGLNGDRLIVYSDLAEPGESGDKADVGIPTQLFPNDGGGMLEAVPKGTTVLYVVTWRPLRNHLCLHE